MRRKIRKRIRLLLGGTALGMLCLVCTNVVTSSKCSNMEIEEYASSKGIKAEEYSKGLIRLFEKNPETRKFVFEYPQKKNITYTIDLTEYRHSHTVPLLMQWDQRWGYASYAGDMIGLSGCGPTCLSMVTIYLTGDTKWNPKKMAEFASDNGYVKKGKGTAWTFFTDGAKAVGLNATELPLNKSQIVKTLETGKPIICSMGPGYFTSSGHFVVMTGYDNGKIRINDPNSYERSKQLWEYDDIAGQIKNLWAFSFHKQ